MGAGHAFKTCCATSQGSLFPVGMGLSVIPPRAVLMGGSEIGSALAMVVLST